MSLQYYRRLAVEQVKGVGKQRLADARTYARTVLGKSRARKKTPRRVMQGFNPLQRGPVRPAIPRVQQNAIIGTNEPKTTPPTPKPEPPPVINIAPRRHRESCNAFIGTRRRFRVDEYYFVCANCGLGRARHDE